jgi:hypothetical protein
LFCQNENVIEPEPEYKSLVVFDRFGKQYTLEEIDLTPKRDVILREELLESRLIQCAATAGIFDLYFENGSGFEDINNPEHNARRAVLCQVFSDISNFIYSPLNNGTNRVRIWVRRIDQLNGFNPNVLGLATGFYCVPAATTIVDGGIADNEIWKTINSGQDSYTNVQNPIISTNNSAPGPSSTFYHGMMAINPKIKWFTNLAQNCPADRIDLYTVVLHEVTHALGFASLISQTGASNFGPGFNYYSRYDTFLRLGNTPLIANNNTACSQVMYDYQSNNLNYGLPSCTNQGVNSNSTNCSTAVHFNGFTNTPIYTPNCFESGSSLSHFEDLCYTNPATNAIAGNDLYFVMSNANGFGVTKRFFTNEERTALNNIGYTTRASYGSVTTFNGVINYGSEGSGTRVAAINDAVISTTPQFVANINTPITVTGILANDFSFTVSNGSIVNDVQNLRFECVQDLYESSSIISHTGNLVNGSITFQSDSPGIHVLRYVPFNVVTGERGNIGYVYVLIRSPFTTTCGTPTNCDLILNGDFRQSLNNDPPNATSEFWRVCGWRSASDSATPDYFRFRNFIYGVNIPCNRFGNQDSVDISESNADKAYAGFFINGTPTSVYSEIILSQLASPLQPNTTYRFEIDVSLADGVSSTQRAIQIYFSNNQDLQLTSNFLTGPLDANVFLETPIITNTNDWTHFTINFTTGNNAGQQFIYIGGLRAPIPTSTLPPTNFTNCVGLSNLNMNNDNVSSYYYIDNVSLVPIPAQYSLNFPQTVCNVGVIENLSDYVINANPNGVFTGSGVINNNGIFSFNPSVAGVGIHTITYTIPPFLGCPSLSINSNITVVATCSEPYFSQVYINHNQNSNYLEIKNPSNQTILPGTYFINLFETGDTSIPPTMSMDVGLLNPNEAKVFQNFDATVPNYAVTNLNILDFNIFGTGEVITISAFNNANAFNNRIDIIGLPNTEWCRERSLVRCRCFGVAPSQSFDPREWVEFTLDEIENQYNNSSKTNAILGRHFDDTISWNTNGWDDASSDESNPDRSRAVAIQTNYNTATNGDFETCSLAVESNQTLIIAANDYVSVEANINVGNNANINVLNNGSLVQVRDHANGITGTDLITKVGTGQINISRTTVGLDAYTDYVYWGTPLANIPANATTNTANNLFPSPPFNSSRFYGFENANFQDIPNWFNGASSTSPYANGYDDNLDDYFVLTPTQRAQQLNAGLGYITWPPSGCSGVGCNYTITFSGTPNNGEITVPVFHNEPSNSFANLVSNPYPSAINLDRFFELNAGVIDPVAYIWGRSVDLNDIPDPNNPGPYQLSYSEDNFLIYNPTMMILPNSIGNQIFDDLNEDLISDSDNLASCQSFFVQTVANNPDFDYSATLTFNNSLRSKEENNTFARNSLPNIKEDNKLWLDLKSENNKSSQIGIAFLENATDDYNSKEDVKAISGKKLNLYTKTTEQDLIIDAQSKFNSNKIIPLGITSFRENKSYSISVNKVTGELKNQTIYLEDTLLKTTTNITQKPYQFSLDNPIVDDRFILRFDNKSSTNETKSKNQIDIVYNEKNIEVISKTKNIKSIVITDIYIVALSGIEIKKIDNIFSKRHTLVLDKRYPIINIKVLFEDGSYITKKMML